MTLKEWSPVYDHTQLLVKWNLARSHERSERGKEGGGNVERRKGQRGFKGWWAEL